MVFDFETDGKYSDTCSPVQIGAVVIHPVKLEIIPNSEFMINIKPEGIDNLDTYLTKERQETIKWHAQQKKCTSDDIIKEWQSYPDQKFAWGQFTDYTRKYNPKGTMWDACVPGGINIRDFDLVIADRLNKKYDFKNMFWPRDKVDILDLAFLWLQWVPDGPKKHTMDALRDFFGMSRENAHDALQDVRDESALIIKFLSLHKYMVENCNIKFKNAFK